MPFLQLTIDLAGLDADEVEAACFATGALSVTLSDAQDEPILEPAPGATPLWSSTRFSVLYPAEINREAILATLGAMLGVSPSSCEFSAVEDRVWEREWLKDFRPMRFGRRLWVCPHGQSAPDPDAIVVYLDPGLAFGTGTHPTTAMCLEWLDSLAPPEEGVMKVTHSFREALFIEERPKTVDNFHDSQEERKKEDLEGRAVIDYGCGSGILAIAAVKLGARCALCVDLDPQALLATRDNAIRNNVGELITTAVPGQIDSSPVDILLANILATPLIDLAPRFSDLVKPGGRIALSGILAEQSSAVTTAYAPWFDMARFAIRKGTSREDWVCLHGVRR